MSFKAINKEYSLGVSINLFYPSGLHLVTNMNIKPSRRVNNPLIDLQSTTLNLSHFTYHKAMIIFK
jgi:hypothetical protein